MAEFVHENPSAKFVLPDTISVRDQLAYISAIMGYKVDIERLWAGALLLMKNWECELIPSPKELDLAKETNPKITQIIAWASWKVKTTIDEMQEVPKN